MKRTDDEWLDELVAMTHQPNPDTPEKRARAIEMTRRFFEIFNYFHMGGPEPDPDWKMEHPPKDDAEREQDIREYLERTSGR